MKILFAASECAPLAKVGGLADVIGSLPKALCSLGIDVHIVLPKYDVIDDATYPSREIERIEVPFGGASEHSAIRQAVLPESNIPVYFLDHPAYLGNGGVYIETDASSGGSNAELNRFGFFSRAIPEVIKAIGWQPDIVHCHDWQTGAVPAILKILLKENTPRTLFTIHNLAYQGVNPRAALRRAFGDAIASTLKAHPHNHDEINFLASALVTADRVSTVSPSYAQEITTKAYGNGLDDILLRLPHPSIGILNGIDTEYWNPATDRFLPEHYGASLGEAYIKAKIKKHFLNKIQLPFSPAIPLFVMVSRLTAQKGFDTLIPTLKELLPKKNIQCAILATGDKHYAQTLHRLAANHIESLHFVEAFDEPLAHLMYAAGDFFLMPSRFEPCGLGQMIAMRYGTVPIATAVGGLNDTVQNDETGYIVLSHDREALASTIQRAIDDFCQAPNVLERLRANGMRNDFSWTHSAKEYVKLYSELL